MPVGEGPDSDQGCYITIYGPPKSEKTSACSFIEGAKWLVSDPNCLPTLRALGRVPKKENYYALKSLDGLRTWVDQAISVAERYGPEALKCPAVILDSWTQFMDWAQQDIARETGQTFMGENPKSNGWQKLNASFGLAIDEMAQLSKYVPVITIAHAAAKADFSKGAWAGLSLPPKMAEKLGRTASWVLFQSKRAYTPDEGQEPDEYVRIDTLPSGLKVATEVVIYTRTIDLWTVACSSRRDPKTGEPVLAIEEPANMYALLKKEGLLK